MTNINIILSIKNNLTFLKEILLLNNLSDFKNLNEFEDFNKFNKDYFIYILLINSLRNNRLNDFNYLIDKFKNIKIPNSILLYLVDLCIKYNRINYIDLILNLINSNYNTLCYIINKYLYLNNTDITNKIFTFIINNNIKFINIESNSKIIINKLYLKYNINQKDILNNFLFINLDLTYKYLNKLSLDYNIPNNEMKLCELNLKKDNINFLNSFNAKKCNSKIIKNYNFYIENKINKEFLNNLIEKKDINQLNNIFIELCKNNKIINYIYLLENIKYLDDGIIISIKKKYLHQLKILINNINDTNVKNQNNILIEIANIDEIEMKFYDLLKKLKIKNIQKVLLGLIKNKNNKICKFIINKYHQNINFENIYLHYTLRYENYEIFKFLFNINNNYKIDVNCFLNACYSQNLELIFYITNHNTFNFSQKIFLDGLYEICLNKEKYNINNISNNDYNIYIVLYNYLEYFNYYKNNNINNIIDLILISDNILIVIDLIINFIDNNINNFLTLKFMYFMKKIFYNCIKTNSFEIILLLFYINYLFVKENHFEKHFLELKYNVSDNILRLLIDLFTNKELIIYNILPELTLYNCELSEILYLYYIENNK